MADAPKINPTDTLRESYPKLNQAIDNANEAIAKATTADENASQAVTTANSVQEQFNQVVIEGDSSVEAAQARVSYTGTTYTTLKDRLDQEHESVTAQLAEITQEIMILPEFFGASPTADATTNRIAIQQALDIGGNVYLGTAGTFLIDTTLLIGDNTRFELSPNTAIQIVDGANKNMLQNKAVSDNLNRNKNIEVIGGKWNMPTNNGKGTDLHCIVFRRVDGLHVHDLSIDTKSGKYAVNLGDCTNFEVDHITFLNVNSDGVHINGPASDGRVHHIRGITDDDSVAITGNDYDAYADVYGDVTNVRIYDINTTSNAANVVKILAGQNCKVDDITIENIRGLHFQNGVWIGDDNGNARTDNGTHGRIIVRDIETVGTDDVTNTSNTIFTNIATGANELIFEKVVLRSGLSKRAINLGVDATGVVKTLQVKDITVDGLSGRRAVALRTAAGATVNFLEIQSPTMNVVGGNGILLEIPSTNVGSVFISNPNLFTDDTSNTNWILQGDQSPISSISIIGGNIVGGKDVINSSHTGTYILTGGLTVSGINRIANLYGGDHKFILGEVNIVSTINKLLFIDASGGNLTVIGGEGTSLPDSPALIERPGTQTLRVNGVKLKADMGIVKGQMGDMLTTIVRQGNINVGHPVISDGAGTWKSLINGETWLSSVV